MNTITESIQMNFIAEIKQKVRQAQYDTMINKLVLKES